MLTEFERNLLAISIMLVASFTGMYFMSTGHMNSRARRCAEFSSNPNIPEQIKLQYAAKNCQ